jgi:lariat debranching enzyme
VNFGGLRIGGLSGIYNKHNYHRGFDEVQPLTGSDINSIYHIRRMSVYKMELIQKPIDIFLTHDWPRDIVAHGDKQKLLKAKKFLAREIEQKTLGSPPAEILLKKLKPSYWFSAHMHTKFEATVYHGQPINQNPDQILIEDSDMENSDENSQQKGENSNKRKRSNSPKLDEPLITKFLALDKCLPNRKFLEVLQY